MDHFGPVHFPTVPRPLPTLTLQSLLFYFDFLAFFCFPDFPCFLSVFLPFPRILGVPRREKTLAFLGDFPCFIQKSKGWRVRETEKSEVRELSGKESGNSSGTPFLSGPQKGPAERGHVKKTSKIIKKCQKYFRDFSTFFAQGKKIQKSSKRVKIFFDTFRQFSRGTSFPAPFGGL